MATSDSETKLTIFLEKLYKLYIVYVLLGVVWTAIAWAFFRDSQTNNETLFNAVILAAAAFSLAIGVVLAGTYRLYVRAKEKSDEAQNELLRRRKSAQLYEDVTTNFVEIAERNRISDEFIFNSLFKTLEHPVSKTAIHRNHDEIERNIQTTVDSAGTLFRLLTGYRCGICIKTIQSEPGVHAEKWRVITERRDLQSDVKRHDDGRSAALISENTDFHDIVVKGKRFFVCDDLESAEGAGKYKNSNPTYRDRYNASLVIPLRDIMKEVNSEYPQYLLCIDNLNGRLSSVMAFNYGKEFASRLSLMIYKRDTYAAYLQEHFSDIQVDIDPDIGGPEGEEGDKGQDQGSR